MTALPRAQLHARFVFVVGKGGTGKSTTAVSLAREFAHNGERTCVISTDPAHSLNDILRHEAAAHSAPLPDSSLLSVEEHDARAHAEQWFSAVRTELAEAIERGTYLDAADARGLLDLTLPGVDEVMGALRLAELSREAWQRIVVDTAPTGHMLRLLDAHSQIDGWITALRAMSEKAGVVASALLRTNVRLPVEDVLDRLETQLDAFRNDVLGNADFVVVTRAGAPVESETKRLIAELRARGLRVAATVQVDARSPSTARVSAAHRNDAIAALLERELVIFAGKGGVGKTTCACAAAVAVARTRPVELFSTDPAGSLADVLAQDVGTSATPVADRLRARQLDARAEFESVRGRYADEVAAVFRGIGLDESASLDRRVIESLWGAAPPGMDEVFALSEILDARGPDHTLLVDSAPTGHFLRLIEMPEIAVEWAHALMRLLVKYHAVAALDAAAREILGFAKRVKELRAALADARRTAIFVVTLQEPIVEAETRRLVGTLQKAGLPVAAVLVNRADEGSPERLLKPGGATLLAPNLPQPPLGRAPLEKFFDAWKLIA